MSNNEYEHGTWKLPSAEYAAFRQEIQKVEHDHKKRTFDMTQDFWKGLTRKEQVDPAAYRAALNAWSMKAYQSNNAALRTTNHDLQEALSEAHSELERKVGDHQTWDNATESWVPATGKPGRVLQSDIDWPTNRTTSFRMGDAKVTFNPDTKTVDWNVAENNHAVENARATALGKSFFRRLDTIKWTPGTGGYTKYDSENNEDEFGGRRGSSISGGWGYIGIDEYNYAGQISSMAPWQNAKGEWIGSAIVTARDGTITMKAVKGTVARSFGGPKFTPAPQPTKDSPAKKPTPTKTASTSGAAAGRGVTKEGTNTGSFKSREHGESDVRLGRTTSLPDSSPFARTGDIDDLIHAWDTATSPENLARDGAATIVEQRAAFQRLSNEYRARMKELS
jgi:hypothetical protein